MAAYCELEKGDPEAGHGHAAPQYQDTSTSRATINLTLPWHCIVEEIADLNLKIVNGHINKRMKPSRPAKPWGLNDFFMGSGYPTHNLESLVPYPESLALPEEQTAEDQPFLSSTQAPREQIDVTSGFVFPSCFPVEGT